MRLISDYPKCAIRHSAVIGFFFFSGVMTLLERKRDISAESLFTAVKEGGGGGGASAAVKNIKENPGVMLFFFSVSSKWFAQAYLIA